MLELVLKQNATRHEHLISLYNLNRYYCTQLFIGLDSDINICRLDINKLDIICTSLHSKTLGAYWYKYRKEIQKLTFCYPREGCFESPQ